MFVRRATDRICLDDDPSNGITIKQKLNYGESLDLQDALAEVGIDMRTQRMPEKLNMHMGAFQLTLSEVYIVDWDGPKTINPETGMKVPVSKESIRQMDITDPLVQKVMRLIMQRYVRQMNGDSPNPKSATANGSTTHGEPSFAATAQNPSDATTP